MRTSYLALAVTAIAGVVVAGCGSAGGDATGTATGGTATGGSAKPAKVAYLTYTYNDYTQAEEKGLKEAVEPGGGSVTVFNGNFDAQKQQQQCQDAITSQRFNVIVLDPSDAPLGVLCATAAKAANIPVIAVENPVGPNRDTIEPQLPGVVGSSVMTQKAIVDGQMQQLRAACAGLDPCKVIAEIAAPGDPLTSKIVRAARAEPNVEVLQVLAAEYDPGTIAKEMPDALTAHSDVDVFLSAADSQALATIGAFKQAGLFGKVKIIGNGGSRLGKPAIADGTLFSTM
ncbi:MAG TPA: substrate-binding domain-containing protein, partial [Baekduia sp.]|nr:substrate-binding domain-containing protein [Baekduia sp.]